MNLFWIDWVIFGTVIAILISASLRTRRYTRSVADFLVANRCGGKYMIGVADGIAGLGAITIVANFEMHYKAGFCGAWWNTMVLPIGVIVAMTGWLQYRYRQTRAMTMAQFLEIRYSRSFRLFSGILAYISGILNFGIFPAVGGRFFQYYLGLPPAMVNIGFTEIDLTYAMLMLALLSISLWITMTGGQIAVMVTDFLQGSFTNVAFCVITAYLLFFRFEWGEIIEATAFAPENASLINPAFSGDTDNFDATYFLIQVFGAFINLLAWQGNQGYFASAKTPHAARMGRIIGSFRFIIQTVPIMLLALGAYVILHHDNFTDIAAQVQQVFTGIDNPQIQSQQTVSIAVARFLPAGMIGIFAALMFAAFVSTHDTYLHSWGSIFIQDVVLPFRQLIRGDDVKMSPEVHMRLLRWSMIGVAGFIFVFSMFFYQKLDIYMFFSLTGNIFLGWAGWVITFGLYWKRGNTAGAWAGSITGVILAFVGWYAIYFWPDCKAIFSSIAPGLWAAAGESWPDILGDECPINAQTLFFILMLITGTVYVIASLLIRPKIFNMDKLLHRGKYAIEADQEEAPKLGLAALKMTREFAMDDKILYITSLAYVFISFGGFLVITSMFVVFGVSFSEGFWSTFWWWYCIVMLLLSSILSIWFVIGGTYDYVDLFKRLKTAVRDDADDGHVDKISNNNQ